MFLKDSSSMTRALSLRPDGGFRILELHNTDATPDDAAAIGEALGQVVTAKRPDLVLLTGDITKNIADADTLRGVLTLLLGSLIENKIPFANTFGDFDRSGGLSNAEQLQVYQSLPGCLTVAGPEALSGVGNYLVPVTAADGSLAAAIWCMDTGAHIEEYEKAFHSPYKARLSTPLYTEFYVEGVHFNQSMWYWHTSRELEQNCGRKIPGVMFFHIPTVEHTIVPMNASLVGMQGVQREQVPCGTVSGGIFSAVMERRDVSGIWCGHTRWQSNEFVGSYCGVRVGISSCFSAGKQAYRILDFANGRFHETKPF